MEMVEVREAPGLNRGKGGCEKASLGSDPLSFGNRERLTEIGVLCTVLAEAEPAKAIFPQAEP